MNTAHFTISVFEHHVFHDGEAASVRLVQTQLLQPINADKIQWDTLPYIIGNH